MFVPLNWYVSQGDSPPGTPVLLPTLVIFHHSTSLECASLHTRRLPRHPWCEHPLAMLISVSQGGSSVGGKIKFND